MLHRTSVQHIGLDGKTGRVNCTRMECSIWPGWESSIRGGCREIGGPFNYSIYLFILFYIFL